MERTKRRDTAGDGPCMIEKRGRRDTLACGTNGQTGRHSDGVSKVLLCKDILFLAHGLVLIGGISWEENTCTTNIQHPRERHFSVLGEENLDVRCGTGEDLQLLQLGKKNGFFFVIFCANSTIVGAD